MTCISCAASISKNLNKRKGVESCDVNFPSHQAKIAFDESVISLDQVKKIIIATGFGIESKSSEENNSERSQIVKVIASMLLALPLLTRMFWHWEIPGEFLGVSFTNWLQHDLAFLAVFITGWQFHKNAFSKIKKGQTSMDTLISIGTLSAYFYSTWAMFSGRVLYFESAATITALILLGKYLELRTINRASHATKKLLELGAKKARVLINNGDVVEKSIEKLKVGDIFLVKPGEKIALDGLVIEGESNVDESMLTGESMPIHKKKNSEVYGATINANGALKVKVNKTVQDSMLTSIINTVEEAQKYKAPIQKLVDKISSIFVPTIIAIAFFTFTGWYLWSGNITISIINAVTVLIISCPCALGLATPLAVTIGSSIGAKEGILIKNGESFEKAKNVNLVAFDKTGTLTVGKPQVSDMLVNKKCDYSKNALINIASSLANKSSHPISRAIVKYKNVGKMQEVGKFKEVIGKGVEGFVEMNKLSLGNIKILEQNDIDTNWANKVIDDHKNKPGTISFLTINKNAVAAFIINDKIKENSKQAIDELKYIKLPSILISGDNKATTKTVSNKLGIDRFLAEVLPNDKHKTIKTLQKEGQRVVFAGDGINDAPSLVQADLGIAMGSGSDIAKESGDIIIIKDDPMKIVEAIKLSKKTFSIIKQNLFWAFFYNTLAIPLAVFGFVNPMVGAIAMSLSDISIVANSMRIYRR